MTSLLSRRRLDVSAAQSVDDLTQVKQIPESAQIVVAIADIAPPAFVPPLPGPIRFRRPACVRRLSRTTPKQNSSGGKQKQGRISKLGNRNLRKLLVVRMRCCFP
jgi:transposase